MDRIAITGGAQLNGEIPISGAKNSAIKGRCRPGEQVHLRAPRAAVT